MELNKLTIGPHVEGIIRIAATPVQMDDGVKLRYEGQMEVLSRLHEEATAEHIIPRLSAHPARASLMEHAPNKESGKLVEIPIRMFFNKTENALTAKYQAYETLTGAPVCTGDGEKAQRMQRAEGGAVAKAEVVCPDPEMCQLVTSGNANCRRQVTMSVEMKDDSAGLGVFEVRTSSYHSYKTLKAQLHLIEARFGGLRQVPLKLQIWSASTKASQYEGFDLFKLALDADSEIEAFKATKERREERASVGLVDQPDQVYEGLRNSFGENQASDEFEFVEAFYNELDLTVHAAQRRPTVSPAQVMAKNDGTAQAIIMQAMKNSQRTPPPIPKQTQEAGEPANG